MRVGVVDIGTNSTRLLIADVRDDGTVTELDRRSTVTRLGAGVDRTGVLADDAMERVFATLREYCAALDAAGVEATTGVLTSAVRDAGNGGAFADAVVERFGIDAHAITGDEEAQLTFLGATSGHDPADDRRLVVIDIGGGSTELVVGCRGDVEFHVSTQAGVVRQSERFLHSDPPRPAELQELAEEAAGIFAEAVPPGVRAGVRAGIAVAGTATSCASILQELDPYDPARVQGYRLLLGQVEMLLARLADLSDEQRRHVTGLHPDRAPVIVAGTCLLVEVMRAFGLDEVEVSEHDILRGAALRRAGVAQVSVRRQRGGTGEG
ncbi:MAG TPA: Ppx/GppA phosphatase family protein [Baekduia sp.]|nr:Ppx/GppA phosphatase family protein [Baekduia sp.]